MARRAFVASGLARLTLPACGAVATPCAARVLTYHAVADAPHDPFAVAPAHFATQMRWLAESGRAISLDQLEALLAGSRAVPPGAVLVTLDDGDVSLCEAAAPVLARHGVPAVAFVPAGEIGTSPRGAHARRLSWSELRAVSRAGVTIGSHAWTHESLGRQSPAEVRVQGERSRKALEDALGTSVVVLAYPFGTRRDFTPTTRAILAEIGYRLLFTSQHGAVRPGTDPLELPRIKVEGGEGMWMFRGLARGALDGWGVVDRTLWWLQATPG